MTTKATQVDPNFIKQYTVKAANTVRRGVPVMLDAGYIVECDSDDDLYIGVAYSFEQGTKSVAGKNWTAAAGALLGVVLRGSPCVVPVRSTATGMTAGAAVCPASGGCQDVTVGGGTVLTNIVGQAVDTVTADGDIGGVNMAAGCFSVTAA